MPLRHGASIPWEQVLSHCNEVIYNFGKGVALFKGYYVSTLMTRHEDDILLVYFQDIRIIDEPRIQNLGQDLINLIKDGKERKVILNLDNVSFMSSAMIGKLILFGKKCSSNNVDLRICNINPNIREVFDLMKLDRVFKVDENEHDAVAAFSKKSWF
jgi:anti-sigma B factor antagonist